MGLWARLGVTAVVTLGLSAGLWAVLQTVGIDQVIGAGAAAGLAAVLAALGATWVARARDSSELTPTDGVNVSRSPYGHAVGEAHGPVFGPGANFSGAVVTIHPRPTSEGAVTSTPDDVTSRVGRNVIRLQPPPPPELAVHREPELSTMRRNLVQRPDAILAALAGAPGSGKTVLAQQLAADSAVRAKYPAGTLWVSAGLEQTSAELLAVLQDAHERITGRRTGLQTIEQVSLQLREAIANIQLLVVLDNAWHSWQLDPWVKTCSGIASLLITTRDKATVPAAATVVDVGLMPDHEMRSLLSIELPTQNDQSMLRLIRRIGGSPLLGSLVRSAMAAAIRDGDDPARSSKLIEELLERQGWLAFDAHGQYRNIQAGLNLVLSRYALQPSASTATTLTGTLAIFPPDMNIPVSIVGDLWSELADLSMSETRSLCRRLSELFVVRYLSTPVETVRVHDVLHDILRAEHADNLVGWHRNLLKSWRTKNVDWWRIPAEDIYQRQRLSYHLQRAGLGGELRSLVRDWRFLASQFLSSGTYQVDTDIEIAAAVTAGPERDRIELLRSRCSQISHLVTRLSEPIDIAEVLRNYVLDEADIVNRQENPYHGADWVYFRPALPLPDSPDPQLIRFFRIGDEHVPLAFSSDQQLIYGSPGNDVYGLARRRFGPPPESLGATHGRVTCWSLDSGLPQETIDTGLSDVTRIYPSPQRGEFIAYGSDDSAYVAEDEIRSVRLGWHVAVHWAARRVLTSRDDSLVLISLDDFIEHEMPIPWQGSDLFGRRVAGLCFDAEGRRFAAVSPCGDVAVYETERKLFCGSRRQVDENRPKR